MPIDRFLSYMINERNFSPLTVKSYASDLRQWQEYASRRGGSPIDFTKITTGDIRSWLLARATAGDGARTLRRKAQALRAFFRFLMKQGDVADNPTTMLELAKVPKRLPQYVRQANLNSLLDAEVDENDFDAVRNRLIIMILYETGIRRAELIGLRDINVDTERGEIKVRGKRDKDRIVPIGDELVRNICSYRNLRNSQVGSTPHFFARTNGGPLYPSLVYHIVHDSLAAVGGSDKKSPHVLRHSFASAMLNDGATLNSVKELLGHESLAATQIYTHITFEELKQSYNHAHPRALKKGG